jgi:hydroxyethylthiazole kinase-like uncharacterized protein yjeF
MSDQEAITGTLAKAADRYAMETLGMKSLELMEHASAKIADYIIKHFADQKNVSISILSGVGNNGADGVCAGRILLKAGYKPRVYIIGKPEKASWEMLYQLFYFTQAGGEVRLYCEGDPLPDGDILIDGIFGIGLHRPIEGNYRSFIAEANAHPHAFTLAIDVPSGINSDTGELMGIGIQADVTITFGRNKIGMLRDPGRSYAGEVLVEDIGIPDEVYDRLKSAGR